MATLATLVVKLTADTGEFVDNMRGAKKGVGGLLSGIGKNVQAVGTAALGGLGVVAGAAGTAGAALLSLAKDAAPLEQIRAAFEGIAETSGESADKMLRALEEGSAGMIAQRDLMLSYNKAAQLVSPTFANQLPGALGALGKVAAATGQDMGFLLDSLVTGVGRLSPMILDNLAIQVDLTAAYEAWAAQNGVAVDEMTKAQQQAALMAQVMEKLAENTASMPDVAGSATAGIAGLQATMQNWKDEVGSATLPVLTILLNILTRLAGVVLPPLTAFLEGVLVPAFTKLAQGLELFVGRLVEGQGPIQALQGTLMEMGFGQLALEIELVRQKVEAFIGKAMEALGPIITWVEENVELQDVLIGLGVAIASVIIPALASVIASVAPVIAVFLAVVAVVVLVRRMWETHGEAIRAKAQEIWDKVVGIFEWFRDYYSKIFEAFALAFEGDWYGFGQKLREAWDQIWEQIKEIGVRAWDAIRTFFTETDWGAVGRSILEGIAKGITAGLKFIRDAARNAAQAALDAAKGFLGIKSPSRAFVGVGKFAVEGFAVGLRQTDPIEQAAQRMGGRAMQAAQAGTQYSVGGIYGPVYIQGVQDGRGLLEDLADLDV